MMPSLSPATPGAPLKSDPGTLRLLADEKRAAGELGDADACERAAAALGRILNPVPSLTAVQADVLELLRRHGRDHGYIPTPGVLAEMLGMAPSTLSGHLAALVEAGLLVQSGEKGRRRYALVASDAAFTREEAL